MLLFPQPFRTCLVAGLTAVALGGCSVFPQVYKLEIQQGNIVSQDMIDQLEPGMTKRQVRYLMGTPLLVDTFHQDRWDYFYSVRDGSGETVSERLTLFFVSGRLDNMDGNFMPREAAEYEGSEATVTAPAAPQEMINLDAGGARGPSADAEAFPLVEPEIEEIEPQPEAAPSPAPSAVEDQDIGPTDEITPVE